MSWDHRRPKQLKAERDAAVKHQVVNLVGPCAPFWRQQLSLVGLSPKSINGLAALSRIPAVGERDLCPDGDPASAARMVLQTDERGFAMRATGYEMRSAYARRLFSTTSYRRRVDATIRPTTYHEGGMAIRFPIASTRGDLDLVARAGFRMIRIMGLGRQDVVALTIADTTSMEAISMRYACIGAGCPAVETAGDLDALARALTVMPISVLVSTPDEAVDMIDTLAESDVALGGVHTVVLVGGTNSRKRVEVRDALSRAGSSAVVLFAWGPRDGRVLYAECRESVIAGRPSGLHTYPDLDVVQVVDPETGDSVPEDSDGELVVTQLGFWGSALLRWRTGARITEGIDKRTCSECHRTVARIPGEIEVDALAAPLDDELVDLRVIAGALLGRPDLRDWRIEAVPTKSKVIVHIVTAGGDDEQVAASVQRDVRRACGASIKQVAVHSELGPWPEQPGRLSPRILVRPS